MSPRLAPLGWNSRNYDPAPPPSRWRAEIVGVELGDREESIELVQQAVAGRVDDEEATQIAVRAGGNPFFIVETTGMPMPEAGRSPSPAGSVPTVQAVVLARLDRQARYVADQIEGARWVELPGVDHLPFVPHRRLHRLELPEEHRGITQPAHEQGRLPHPGGPDLWVIVPVAVQYVHHCAFSAS